MDSIEIKEDLKKQLINLRTRFLTRTKTIKTKLEDNESINEETEEISNSLNDADFKLKFLNKVIGIGDKPSDGIETKVEVKSRFTKLKHKTKIFLHKHYIIGPIELQSLSYLLWLALVSIAYIYNIIGITLCASFGYDKQIQMINDTIISETKINYWIVADYLSDFIYLIDLIAVETRIKFIHEGLWICDYKLMAKNYLKSYKFWLDCASIVPIDLIQIFIGWNVLTRINRILKINSLWEFYDRWDKYVQNIVFLVRFIKLMMYLLIVNHFYTCAYYSFSQWEVKTRDIKNDWVYTKDEYDINEYLYSFLFALRTGTAIGNNPAPVTEFEYLFTTIAYMISIFIFALIVGQVRDIVGSLTKKQDEYLETVDRTMTHLKNLGVSKEMRNKVRLYFDYTLNQNESSIDLSSLTFLPINLQTDLAISVYFDMLSKVQLFQDCEKSLLYSLVLRIKPVLFMPSDYICKKGDVGREMYIVDRGIVEVVVNGSPVAQLKKGSVFGEISLLSLGAGGNRRTADVVSKGFSTLYVLHKDDLNEVLRDYPDVEKLLRRKAKKLLNKSKKDDFKIDAIIKETPAIIDALSNFTKKHRQLIEINEAEKRESLRRQKLLENLPQIEKALFNYNRVECL